MCSKNELVGDDEQCILGATPLSREKKPPQPYFSSCLGETNYVAKRSGNKNGVLGSCVRQTDNKVLSVSSVESFDPGTINKRTNERMAYRLTELTNEEPPT